MTPTRHATKVKETQASALEIEKTAQYSLKPFQNLEFSKNSLE